MKKLCHIIFGETILRRGISPQDFSRILTALPDGSMIVGINKHETKAIVRLVVENLAFPETPVNLPIPEIVATIAPDKVTFEWPDEFFKAKFQKTLSDEDNLLDHFKEPDQYLTIPNSYGVNTITLGGSYLGNKYPAKS